jgi:hypothetical protein
MNIQNYLMLSNLNMIVYTIEMRYLKFLINALKNTTSPIPDRLPSFNEKFLKEASKKLN